MNERNFLDSNVLIYTDDQDTLQKQQCALDLIEQARRKDNGVVSTQVLQEYHTTWQVSPWFIQRVRAGARVS